MARIEVDCNMNTRENDRLVFFVLYTHQGHSKRNNNGYVL